ncbi:hypothetical protein LX15_000188 [Streptoalloteichus tenebrarius]|uniref:Uncharacterized protein n=1 Tax=Streptoalloteichus tenebrarius (strain ATCC 17920 / DSM 40477 / JCM 4838 / CBS 697.72 / NBRC 16177 / NCIMB 11028 / NRRL B-12390 / A12253. 1 / ISP 5477) TaxID=1933 RepID=A0ABT1HLX9_STRSD|nr:type I-E CRISPR-associated protein Cse1/CasA [Streptoalloteichus tenebrarius]MCP2256505.1 hypothetical protein [Streptoalloteichus tenebrarius]BFF04857.1 hypothetical protein GCM10020241_65320 [Streptoalloteichus tenebrarius]
MTPSFDLAIQPWIPVIDKDGKPRRMGLQDVLVHAHDLTELDLPLPPAEAALWRVLSAIAYEITGLGESGVDPDEWRSRQERLVRDGRFDEAEIKKYFVGYSGRFDLFHPERPWLQDPRLRQQCAETAGINKLVLGRPVGVNGPTWWTRHHQGRQQPVPAAEGAWWLLVHWYYGAAGRCSTRKVGSVSSASRTAGPLRGRMSYHPKGDTLFVSLLASMVPPPQREQGEDRCPWEWSNLPDPLSPPPLVRGVRGALTTPLTRTGDAVSGLCVIATSTVTDGTRGALTRWLLEPKAGVYVGTLTRRVRESLWRGLCQSISAQGGWAVLVYSSANEQGFEIDTFGEYRRVPIDFDGLTLIAWPRQALETDETTEITEW